MVPVTESVLAGQHEHRDLPGLLAWVRPVICTGSGLSAVVTMTIPLR
jgi:hypothetical protein